MDVLSRRKVSESSLTPPFESVFVIGLRECVGDLLNFILTVTIYDHSYTSLTLRVYDDPPSPFTMFVKPFVGKNLSLCM